MCGSGFENSSSFGVLCSNQYAIDRAGGSSSIILRVMMIHCLLLYFFLSGGYLLPIFPILFVFLQNKFYIILKVNYCSIPPEIDHRLIFDHCDFFFHM